MKNINADIKKSNVTCCFGWEQMDGLLRMGSKNRQETLTRFRYRTIFSTIAPIAEFINLLRTVYKSEARSRSRACEAKNGTCEKQYETSL